MASRAEIRLAAEECYSPEAKQSRHNAVVHVIESLVLPAGVELYTDDDMQGYITAALEALGRAPR